MEKSTKGRRRIVLALALATAVSLPLFVVFVRGAPTRSGARATSKEYAGKVLARQSLKEFRRKYPEIWRPTVAIAFVPGNYEKLVDSPCASEYLKRSGVSLGVVAGTFEVTLDVSGQYARLEQVQVIEGSGDDQLCQCYVEHSAWPKDRYAVPSAEDGRYRFELPFKFPVRSAAGPG